MIEKCPLLSAHATLHRKKGQAKYHGIQLRFQLYLKEHLTLQAHICVPFGRAKNFDQQTCKLFITQNGQHHFQLRISLHL